jgi:acetyl-CoA carboxylase biotin carboxyl carrier protein
MLAVTLLTATLGHDRPPVSQLLAPSVSWPGWSVINLLLWFDRAGRLTPAAPKTSGVKMAEDVRAEIVATVLEVVVSEGDQIGEGDTLVLLESMKMEIPVLAEVAGTVTTVSVSVGDVIQAGDPIAVIS